MHSKYVVTLYVLSNSVLSSIRLLHVQGEHKVTIQLSFLIIIKLRDKIFQYFFLVEYIVGLHIFMVKVLLSFLGILLFIVFNQ